MSVRRENTGKFKSYYKTGASCLLAVNNPTLLQKNNPHEKVIYQSLLPAVIDRVYISKSAEDQLLASCIINRIKIWLCQD